MGRQREEEPCGEERSLKCVLGAILALLSCGPLLCLTIKQVCVSKCLLAKRLPALGSDLEDVLIITLFVLFAMLNYAMCCVLWSLFRKALRWMYLQWLHCTRCCVPMPSYMERWILMDPKITRSGRVYGYRKAKYVVSETSLEERQWDRRGGRGNDLCTDMI